MHYQTLEEVVKPGNILLLGKRLDVQKTALRVGFSARILTGGAVLEEALLKEAKRKGIIVISVNLDTFIAARLLPMMYLLKASCKQKESFCFKTTNLYLRLRKKC